MRAWFTVVFMFSTWLLNSGVMKMARSLLGNPDDAEDALQEAFCRLWPRAETLLTEQDAEIMINAQGRTETITNTIPRYAMLHLQWQFNKMPKKKR